ncbi:aminotransferase class IV [Lewinella sp. 4G2]|uniref:aminotransferase class IV n=1 Tax=Lewinella sp. 4G2 TaxID=1803372 RepID=UPI0007B475D7|nr:aminotransferase class IV [Lewinella sp. 4G2]OAV44949.1 hypothetical protein A3850_010785 [Lewinella sp. 4G2]
MLLESIRLEDGQFSNLALHQKRLDRARRVSFGKPKKLRISDIIDGLDVPQQGTHKLRIVYGEDLISAEFHPYSIKPITSLKVVKADGLDYGHKYSNRDGIKHLFERRGKCDDIIMVKHGYVMDASYANLALYDGRHWYTPAYPMLRGVRREQLLKEKILRPAIIRDRDLGNFQMARLVNAMIPWGAGNDILNIVP